MKIILIENVPSLGKIGDVVPVAPGYGRNFLIPKNLALEATPGNMRQLELQRESFLKKAQNDKRKAEEIASKIQGLTCTITHAAGESEKLFGSVTSKDIQGFLEKQGLTVDRRKINLAHPIRTLGIFEVPIKLHSEVVANLKVNIVPAPVSPEKT
jgi:large subunit ribosomal protein L9